MDDLEYTLDEDAKKLNLKNKWPSKAKIIIGILIAIIILQIIGFILYIIFKPSNEQKENKNENNQENTDYDYSYFSIKYLNISYTDKTIINSFKKDGIHYNETMGEINDGKDYIKSNRNIYDLYIPYKSTQKKKEYNQIILYIHGGGWTKGSKEELDSLCEINLIQGYITANMGYTLISAEYKEYNPSVFRILDEITACIQSIKNILKKEGFNINKLELAIGGASAGGHLSLLYAYSMKNSPIPIKFIIDFVGPVTLDPEHFLKVKNQDEPLNNIDINDIENAKKDNKIEYLFENDTNSVIYMNYLYGNKYSDDELNEMIVNGRLDKNNEKYKKMFNVVINGYPIHFVKSNNIPAICVYGGRDQLIGIDHYAYLKSINEEYGKKLYLIYSRFANHNVFQIDGNPNINLIREIYAQINNFSKLYFTSY